MSSEKVSRKRPTTSIESMEKEKKEKRKEGKHSRKKSGGSIGNCLMSDGSNRDHTDSSQRIGRIRERIAAR